MASDLTVGDLGPDTTVWYTGSRGSSVAAHTEQDCRLLDQSENVFDDPAGALWDEMNVCRACSGNTETGQHTDGGPTEHIRVLDRMDPSDLDALAQTGGAD